VKCVGMLILANVSFSLVLGTLDIEKHCGAIHANAETYLKD
jgi:hypothetical protein